MIALGEVAVIGGGCYGHFYAGQLLAARGRGMVRWRMLRVVDCDPACRAAALLDGAPDTALEACAWDEFLDGWLGDARAANDQVVPSPLMPHLMADWLARRAAARWPAATVQRVPATAAVGTPFDRLHPADGVRYVSWADWLCPVHCIEPHRCPATAAPRTWEMTETATAWTAQWGGEYPAVGPALFPCRHVVHGVGMYPARCATDGERLLAEGLARHPEGVDLVVGSVSACHGALGVLRVTHAAAESA